jgi:arginyl-tRNA synthetase
MIAHNIFAEMLERVRRASEHLIAAGVLPAGIDLLRVTMEPPRDAARGDMATNVAMVLAKDAGKKPRELAEALGERLRADALVAKVEIAGPGFINLTLKSSAWRTTLQNAVQLGAQFGRCDIGSGKPINVEYVSANPTGPMHVGHCRGAVFGDALASLLAFSGFKVTREYYVNDAGAQVDQLARSAYLRYREALGEDIGAIPDGLYQAGRGRACCTIWRCADETIRSRLAAGRAHKSNRDDDGCGAHRSGCAQYRLRRFLFRTVVDRRQGRSRGGNDRLAAGPRLRL